MSTKINDLMLPPVRQDSTQSVSSARLDLVRRLGAPQVEPAVTPRMDLIGRLGGPVAEPGGFVGPRGEGIWAGPDGRGGCIPPYGFPHPLPPDRLPPIYPSPLPLPEPLPGPFPFPRPIPISDITPADLDVASRLHEILSDPETLLMAMFDPDVGETTLHRTPNGVVGPEGQPLFKVKTDLGMTAWVDPNTNQFYLQEPGYGGQLNVIGPMDLPEGAQFDPEAYYTPQEVHELGNVARGGGWDPLHWQDREAASNLHSSLSGLDNWQILSDPYIPSHVLPRGEHGEVRGPEGQPLISVRLDNGQQAYVDPNTNQYYLGEGNRYPGGVSVKGPIDLPEGSRFTNSYFNDREVDALTRIANRHHREYLL